MKTNRLAKLKQTIRDKSIDGVIILQPQNRYYFSGFTGTAGCLLIFNDNQFLLTDFRYIEQAKEECSQYEIVRIEKDLYSTLWELLQKNNLKKVGFEEGFWTYSQHSSFLKVIDDKTELIAVNENISKLRAIKDEEEQRILKQAAELTDSAFSHIISKIKPGIRESDVALELEFYMRQRGATSASFKYIVASGKRGALPHGVATDKVLNEGDMVTIDFGCIYKGYCSDMTRNFVLGTPSAEQMKIYKIVLEAQEEAFKSIKAGVATKEVDSVARSVIEKAGYGDYFGHGLGHGVGLDIHEQPSLSPKSDAVLESGMVVSVEPGIYLPNWGGIRIEDVVIIEEGGFTNLTNSSKELINVTQ